jgi:Flp pilus assembly protein CpaB
VSAERGSLRRAAVLGALAIALALIAVRGVARREAAVDAQIGPVARIVVLVHDVPAGHAIRADDIAYRRVPLRWVAPRTLGTGGEAIGLRTAVALERGTPLVVAVLTSASAQAKDALASGDRVLELLAAGSPRLVQTGSRVDVVRSADGADGSRRTTVVAEGVEVIDVRGADESAADGASQVNVTVRVPRRDALRLAAAQDGSASLRLLPRAAWDKSGLVAAP